MMPEALEWLERASQAPAPNVEDGHQVLYELADALEKPARSRARSRCAWSSSPTRPATATWPSASTGSTKVQTEG